MPTSIIKKTNAAIAGEVLDFLSLKEILLLFTLDTNIFDTSISYARYFSPSKTRISLGISTYWTLFKVLAHKPVNQKERVVKCRLFDKIPKKILAISKKKLPQLCIKTSNKLSYHLSLLNIKKMKSNESFYYYLKYFESTVDFYFQLTGRLCPIKQNTLNFFQSDIFFKDLQSNMLFNYQLTSLLSIFYKIKLDKSSLVLNKKFCTHMLVTKNLKLSKKLITAGVLQLTYLDIIQVGTDLMKKENEKINNTPVAEFVFFIYLFYFAALLLFSMIMMILEEQTFMPPYVAQVAQRMELKRAVRALFLFGMIYAGLAADNLLLEPFKLIHSFLFSKVLEPFLKNNLFSTRTFLFNLIQCMKANNIYPTQQDKENAQAQSWPSILLAEFEEKSKKENYFFGRHWFFQKTNSSRDKNLSCYCPK